MKKAEVSTFPDLKPLTAQQLISIKGGRLTVFDLGKDKRKRPTGS